MTNLTYPPPSSTFEFGGPLLVDSGNVWTIGGTGLVKFIYNP